MMRAARFSSLLLLLLLLVAAAAVGAAARSTLAGLSALAPEDDGGLGGAVRFRALADGGNATGDAPRKSDVTLADPTSAESQYGGGVREYGAPVAGERDAPESGSKYGGADPSRPGVADGTPIDAAPASANRSTAGGRNSTTEYQSEVRRAPAPGAGGAPAQDLFSSGAGAASDEPLPPLANQAKPSDIPAPGTRTGAPGPQGPRGPQGPAGPQGVKGPKGDRGDDGQGSDIPAEEVKLLSRRIEVLEKIKAKMDRLERAVFPAWAEEPNACPDRWNRLGYVEDEARVHCSPPAGEDPNVGNPRCRSVAKFPQVFDRCAWSKHCKVAWALHGCYHAGAEAESAALQPLPPAPAVSLTKEQIEAANKLRDEVIKDNSAFFF